ncbi:hypothetical protein V8F33_001711 [Rhypophila sp. PSN 637]
MSLLQRQDKWIKQEQDSSSLTPIIRTSGVSSTLSSEDTKHPPPRLSPGGLQTFPHVAAPVPRSALIPPGSSHVRSIKTEPLAPFYSPPEDDDRISSVLPPSVLEFVSSEITKSESQFPRSLPVSQIKREPVYDHRKPTKPTRRSRGRPRLSPEHRKPPYEPTGRSRGRPRLSPEHRKPPYKPTGRSRGRPRLSPEHRKPPYKPTGRSRGRPRLSPEHRKPPYKPTGRPRGRPRLNDGNRRPQYEPTGRPRGCPRISHEGWLVQYVLNHMCCRMCGGSFLGN